MEKTKRQYEVKIKKDFCNSPSFNVCGLKENYCFKSQYSCFIEREVEKKNCLECIWFKKN